MSTGFLIFAGIASTVCAFVAGNLAAKQGRNVYMWAGITFLLPAVLLYLMKVEADRQRK